MLEVIGKSYKKTNKAEKAIEKLELAVELKK